MPELPVGFHFTQMRFQDYLDCKRRFQLRYLFKQPWPAQIVEPADLYEKHVEQGKQFHRLVQQYLLGIPVDSLNMLASEPPLSDWWQAFRLHGLEDIPGVRIPETTLATTLSGYRLVGKYDLIARSEPGEVIIVDWKTSRFIPTLSELRLRMQSRVYPYILARAGLVRFGRETVQPDEIKMRYWYAAEPASIREFSYSQEQFTADEAFLEELVEEIQHLEAEVFPLTDDVRQCQYCLYRSLCDRGIRAGSMETLNLDFDDLTAWPEGIDLDQLPEIEF